MTPATQFPRLSALFPISVDNPGFTTELMRAALLALPNRYEELVFLIADDLQLYNKAVAVRSGPELSEMLARFDRKNVSLTEKSRWLNGLRSSLPEEIGTLPWRSIGISTLSDIHFRKVARNLVMLNETVAEFHGDVLAAARAYCARTKKDFTEVDVALSEAYILEEIATNLRIRVHEGIRDEFYVFKYLTPLIKLYAGDYGISVFSLCGLPESGLSFEFYQFERLPSPRWTKAASLAMALCG